MRLRIKKCVHALAPCGGGLEWGVPSELKSTPTISSPIEGEGKNGNSRERLPIRQFQIFAEKAEGFIRAPAVRAGM
jgi:hypothetical protein